MATSESTAIKGDAANNEIIGTPDNDTIFPQGGSDTVSGGLGDD
jgi:Ca2+-binding RTX toxin-like protein